jgi:Na+-driven multidrug efflux pump
MTGKLSQVLSPAGDAARAFQWFQLLRQGAPLLIAILLAKSPLGAERIGVYELLMYVGHTATFFWVTGLTQGLLSLHGYLDEAARRRLLCLSYLGLLILSLLVAALLLGARKPVLFFLTSQPALPHYDLFLLYLCLWLPGYLLEHFFLLEERPKALLGLGLLIFAGQAAAATLPVFAGWGLRGAFWGLILFAAIKHLWLLLFLARRGRFSRPRALWRRWLSLSLPLALYALLGGLNQTLDFWLVNFFFPGDESRFALFRYGARELPLSVALAGAFGAAMVAEVARDRERALALMRRRSLRLFHLIFPLSVGLLLSSAWWYPRVFSFEFAGSAPIFNLFLLAGISRLVFVRSVLVGLHDNYYPLLFSALELALNAALSVWLVACLDLRGIALATVLAATLEKAALCVYLQRRHGIRWHTYLHPGWFFAYSAALIGAWLWTIF